MPHYKNLLATGNTKRLITAFCLLPLSNLVRLPKRAAIKKPPFPIIAKVLVIFERMGMPRESQRCASIDCSTLKAVRFPMMTRWRKLSHRRGRASQRGDVQSAIQYQEQAVSLAKEGQGRGVRNWFR